MYNVIGDIAGRFKTLQLLLAKMPPGIPFSVGDMVDRGKKSREVIEFFMTNGEAVLGNHEHFMYDYVTNMELTAQGKDPAWVYSPYDWIDNGGEFTLESYGGKIPVSHIEYLRNLPIHKLIELDGKKILISHTFLSWAQPLLTEKNSIKDFEDDPRSVTRYTWNRVRPVRITGLDLQITGHNSQFGCRTFSDKDGEFARCLDDSWRSCLTGLHLPTMTIYKQDYVDEDDDDTWVDDKKDKEG